MDNNVIKIGVNGRFLAAKRTGVQRAAYNLLKTLIEIDRTNRYFIFAGEDQLHKPEWAFPNVTVVPSGIREGASIRNHFWEQFTLPTLAKKYKVDVLHSPANIAPLFYSGKSIVHIHDLCFVVNPQWYSFSFRTLYNLVIPRLAKKASKVTTNSNNSKNDLLQFFSLDASRVSLVYWAVDDIFFDQSDHKKEALNWHLKDYILYVGSLEPRKNIRILVEAYEILRNKNPNIKTKLILIGGESPLFGDVRLQIKRYKEDVIFQGFVDDKMLREFYRHASVVAYPSLYEGFGLPPLEAMASGVPVVTSTTSSMPEVVGDAALMINPQNVEELASSLSLVLNDENLRKELIRRGYEQVKKFSWYQAARKTLTIFYEVHNEGKKESQKHISIDLWEKLKLIESLKAKPIIT